ncbi:MAG: ABC transporter ATP-binding protein, partial [Chitinophagales bacterium]
MGELKYLNKFLIKYKWRLLFGILFVALINVTAVVAPKILGTVVDLLQEEMNKVTADKSTFHQTLLYYCLAFLGLALLNGIFKFFMRQTIIVMSRLIEFDVKNEIYKHYQWLDSAFYKRNNTGDLMNRATEDVSRIRMYLGPALMYAINTAFMASFVVVMMFSTNVRLAFWVLLPMPFLAAAIFYIKEHINVASERIQEQLSTLTTYAQEFYSGIRVLKSFVQEKHVNLLYDKESKEYKKRSLHLAKIEALFFPIMILLVGLSMIIVIWVGGDLYIDDKLSMGNLLEFVFYVNMLTWPMTSIGWVASIVQQAAASQKRINDFLDTKPDIQNESSSDFKLKGDIVFNDVSFTYPDTGIEALKNISFNIKNGEKWAIIGRTGSGKTTIADLLFRLYNVSSGEMTIDDENIENVNLYQLRNEIAYVPQDVFLFSDTVRENIRFSDADLSDDVVMQAAKNASIHDEILAFDKGYDTIVGERGVTLSGGQKQRISIARALIKNPSCIIFDDALSAVDAHTEETILKNLNTAIDGKTVIVITHRIFSLLDFDNILVLDDGAIAEIGKH